MPMCKERGNRLTEGCATDGGSSTRMGSFVIIRVSGRRSPPLRAEVAELADAQASGACGRKVVEGQILSSAPTFAVHISSVSFGRQATRRLYAARPSRLAPVRSRPL